MRHFDDTLAYIDRLQRANTAEAICRELLDVTNTLGLRDPLGALMGLAQAAPEAPRTRALAVAAHAIFNGSGDLHDHHVEALDLRALVVLCRLEEEHLSGRYTGEEWGEALKLVAAPGS